MCSVCWLITIQSSLRLKMSQQSSSHLSVYLVMIHSCASKFSIDYSLDLYRFYLNSFLWQTANICKIYMKYSCCRILNFPTTLKSKNYHLLKLFGDCYPLFSQPIFPVKICYPLSIQSLFVQMSHHL